MDKKTFTSEEGMDKIILNLMLLNTVGLGRYLRPPSRVFLRHVMLKHAGETHHLCRSATKLPGVYTGNMYI